MNKIFRPFVKNENMMLMKLLKICQNIIPSLLCTLVVIYCVFIYFPVLGYDYSLFVSWANDYKFAWDKFRVFNIIFTPQRCGGVPVWANPISVNLSLFHILSILLQDIHAIALYIVIYISMSYFSLKKFLNLFDVNNFWATYLCIGWCLQGFIIARAVVGHLTYINIGVWPLYSYILLKKSSNSSSVIHLLLISILYSHDVYSANPYLFAMFPFSFLLMYLILKINKITGFSSCKTVVFRLISMLFISFLISLPKILAIHSFTKNFQREVSFTQNGLPESLNYVLMNFFFPYPLDYKKLVGWWYGNWESISFIYPFMTIFILIKCLINPKENSRLIFSLLLLLIVAVFITIGAYAEFVKVLPMVKSFHVNPRWIPIISLGTLSLVIIFIKKFNFPKILSFFFILLSFLCPLFFLDREYLFVNYTYRHALDLTTNRVNYCYEPVFGYQLELLPRYKLNGKYVDPRCYLGNANCNDFTLPLNLHKNLEEYSLKPFKD